MARTEARLHNLAAAASATQGIIDPIALDYRDSAALQAAIRHSIAELGPVALVVAWIHSSIAPHAARIVAETIAASSSQPFRFFHVLGSVAASPNSEHEQETWIMHVRNMHYRSIVLGFVVGDDGSSRWLTDDEIAHGVRRAIEKDTDRSIIGAIEPWEKRP